MKRRYLLILGIALALVAAACGDDDAASDEPIKIGIIADLTGPFTTYGNRLSRSAQLAVDEINADGGIDGRQIEYKTVGYEAEFGRALGGVVSVVT